MHSNHPPSYLGRFAPSPTGPLHFGSLVAALGSYLDALSHDGIWRVRMEDVDAPRNVPGAADDILRTLEAFGFEWSGEVLWQSHRLEAYAAALAQLRSNGLTFPCACSRKEIADSATRPAIDGGLVYPGTCRSGLPAGQSARAWRMRVDAEILAFDDAIQGPQQQNLVRGIGDFVLLRADGQFAYQLAVVVDDAFQNVTHVVRGADLLDSTPRQIFLQQALGVDTPVYAHLPVVINGAGEKLSKQTCAQAVRPTKAVTSLWAALDFLGQAPPDELRRGDVKELWAWARQHWRLASVPACRTQMRDQPA